MFNQRAQNLCNWASQQLNQTLLSVSPITNDASFRRYFRAQTAIQCYILMDAPPQQENCAPFIDIAQRLTRCGFNAPFIYAQDITQGFLLLSDLGESLYLPALNAHSVERLYGDALSTLAAIQVCVPTTGLPAYDDERLLGEMRLFHEWFLIRHLGLELSAAQVQELEAAFALLCASAQQQPQVFVHRDYHARNLIVTPCQNPGILDFQDALIGPLTYDLVSLLRDVYIAWPTAQVQDWVLGYHTLCRQHGLIGAKVDEAQFIQWVDWMGAQRHLKIAGIFARLWYRDGKPGYLRDIPLTLRYLLQEIQHYPQLAWLTAFITQQVMPRFEKVHAITVSSALADHA